MIANPNIQVLKEHYGGTLHHGARRAALLYALILSTVATMMAALLAPSPAYASTFPGLNGKIVFASTRTTGTGVNNPTGDLEIFTMNPDGTGLKQLTNNQAADANPSYSSDGKKIVFDSQRTGNFDVFVMNADGTGQKNLTKNSAFDRRPSFSPNGKKIVFDSNRGAIQDNIFVMNADGTTPTKLTTSLAADFNATFSPQGDKIAFVSDRGGGDTEIFAMNPDGTAESPLTQNDVKDEDPSFSPNASKVAFASNRDGLNSDDFDVFQMNSDGSSPQRFTSSSARDDLPAFSPDGKKIAYTSTQNGGDEDVLVINSDFNPSGPTDLTANTDFDEAPDWQPSSTFTVTTTADTGLDGICDSNCSLREAINASNNFQAQPKATIAFDIPGTGVQTITPQSELPVISRPVTIDGYSQPGASANTLARGTNAAPKIELDGEDAIGADGLVIQSTSNSVIEGLVINRFTFGIHLLGGSTANRIEGNFLGTDPTGAQKLGNATGVALEGASGNVIGGKSPATRNLISGNSDFGVGIGNSSQSNEVIGNLIGTTASGTGALGNESVGVFLGNVSVSNNKIGDGTSAGSNTVAFNGIDGSAGGIAVVGQISGNSISHNSIFSNVGIGIDLVVDTNSLGVTTNDPRDTDTGANDFQNFPVLTSAKSSTTATSITGKLNSTPGKTFTVEFFSNPAFTDEGKAFVGQKSVTTDSSGNATFTFKPAKSVPVGQTITATATSGAGNTSEFSAPRNVSKATAPTVKKVSPAENATGVSPTSNVTALFSEAMNASTINAKTVTLERAGTNTKVTAKVTYNAATNTAVLNPGANLKLGATYVAMATSGTKSLTGIALDQSPSKAGSQPKSWRFTIRK